MKLSISLIPLLFIILETVAAAPPEEREVKIVPSVHNDAPIFLCGIPTLRAGRDARILVGDFGFRVNSNHEIIHTGLGNGTDLSDFGLTTKTSTYMYLSMDTPTLPITAGVKTITADNQTMQVKVSHLSGYSHVDIKLDPKYRRAPRYMPSYWGGGWNPGGYPGYTTEWPFCYRSMEEALKKLVPTNTSQYLPNYYQVTYVIGQPAISTIKPETDITFQYSYGLRVLVPVKFVRETTGRQIPLHNWKAGQISNHCLNIAPQKIWFENAPTQAVVGAFGIRIYAKRELIHAQVLSEEMGPMTNEPMYLSFDTLQKLPVAAGTRTVTAEGKSISLKVTNYVNSSHVDAKLAADAWRTPWWPKHYLGGGKNPFLYQGYPLERPFYHNTLVEVVEKLVPGSGPDYEPGWYDITYMASAVNLSTLDPTQEVGMQGSFVGQVLVPFFYGSTSSAYIREPVQYPDAATNGDAPVRYYNLTGHRIGQEYTGIRIGVYGNSLQKQLSILPK